MYTSGHRVTTAIRHIEEQIEGKRRTVYGLTRDTRATCEGALDPRSLQILAKFKRAGYYSNLYGCISTGKEANVYAADGVIVYDRFDAQDINQIKVGPGICIHGEPAALDYIEKHEIHRAIKVFKTSILVFKRRHQYVEGEHRFRHGFKGMSNPRKMVRQWAEKEFRNLRRLMSHGIRAPLPVEIRSHIFVMTLIGNNLDETAPRLKDALDGGLLTWKRMYIEVIAIAKQMYRECKLIHGDYSEYNILVLHGHPYVIDVSQSMEANHCHSMQFLRRDCVNITRFFIKKLEAIARMEENDLFQPHEAEEHNEPTRNYTSSSTDEEEEAQNVTKSTDDEAMSTQLAEKLARLSDCLTASEMHKLITSEVNFESKISEWPEYDLKFRVQEWRSVVKAKRLRGLQPVMQKFNLEQLSREDESTQSEADVVENTYCTFKQQSEEQFKKKIRDFNTLCGGILEEVLRLIETRTPDSLIISDTVFLEKNEPLGLKEVRNSWECILVFR